MADGLIRLSGGSYWLVRGFLCIRKYNLAMEIRLHDDGLNFLGWSKRCGLRHHFFPNISENGRRLPPSKYTPSHHIHKESHYPPIDSGFHSEISLKTFPNKRIHHNQSSKRKTTSWNRRMKPLGRANLKLYAVQCCMNSFAFMSNPGKQHYFLKEQYLKFYLFQRVTISINLHKICVSWFLSNCFWLTGGDGL